MQLLLLFGFLPSVSGRKDPRIRFKSHGIDRSCLRSRLSCRFRSMANPPVLQPAIPDKVFATERRRASRRSGPTLRSRSSTGGSHAGEVLMRARFDANAGRKVGHIGHWNGNEKSIIFRHLTKICRMRPFQSKLIPCALLGGPARTGIARAAHLIP